MVAFRGLAALRICLGLAVFFTLLRWLPDFALFFTDDGALTLSALAVDTPPGKVAWSLYNVSGYRWFPFLLFALTLGSSLLLTVGWRCGLSGAVLFVLFWSLQSRTAVASDGWDRALWVALALGVTLPWDRAWSLTLSREPLRRGSLMGTGLMGLAVTAALLNPSGELAGFLALGPRARPLPHDVWYVTLAEDGSGERWNALDRTEPEWDKPGGPPLGYRERLYQGRWEEPEYHGLTVWWAYRHYGLRGEDSHRLRAVKLYRCSKRSGETPYRLVASWPMGLSDGSARPFTQDSLKEARKGAP